jgi:hypothetical protein
MNFCECGHQPGDHCHGIGRCDASEETLWGTAPCTCPKYEWQGDD